MSNLPLLLSGSIGVRMIWLGWEEEALPKPCFARSWLAL